MLASCCAVSSDCSLSKIRISLRNALKSSIKLKDASILTLRRNDRNHNHHFFSGIVISTEAYRHLAPLGHFAVGLLAKILNIRHDELRLVNHIHIDFGKKLRPIVHILIFDLDLNLVCACLLECDSMLLFIRIANNFGNRNRNATADARNRPARGEAISKVESTGILDDSLECLRLADRIRAIELKKGTVLHRLKLVHFDTSNRGLNVEHLNCRIVGVVASNNRVRAILGSCAENNGEVIGATANFFAQAIKKLDRSCSLLARTAVIGIDNDTLRKEIILRSHIRRNHTLAAESAEVTNLRLIGASYEERIERLTSIVIGVELNLELRRFAFIESIRLGSDHNRLRGGHRSNKLKNNARAVDWISHADLRGERTSGRRRRRCGINKLRKLAVCRAEKTARTDIVEASKLLPAKGIAILNFNLVASFRILDLLSGISVCKLDFKLLRNTSRSTDFGFVER